ncbi:MAG: YabP/YqfC family sporulation protein [Clostridia bacterium]
MNIKDKLSDITCMATSTELLSPNITFFANKQALIQGCKGVLEYNESSVRINCGKLVVKFVGENLSIKALNLDQIEVSGDIINFEFLG